MNQLRPRVYITTLILGFILCGGLLGTIFFMNWDNTGISSQNATFPNSDQRDHSVVDSRSGRTFTQNSLTTETRSISDILNDFGTTFDTKRVLLQFINEATEQELVGVFRESLAYPIATGAMNTTYWLQSLVLAKLVSNNNGQAQSLIKQLDEQTAKTVIYGTMCSWNKVQVNEAITFLASLEDSLRSRGFQGLISGDNFLSRSELLSIGRKLGYEEEYITRLLDQSTQAHAPISFNDLESEFENIPLENRFRVFQLQRKAVAYVRAEGLDSLRPVLELFDKLSTNEAWGLEQILFQHQRSRLVADLAKDNPEEVFEHVLHLDEDVDVDLLSAISEEWFKTAPEALWNRLKSVELLEFQVEIAEDMIRSLTRKHPDLSLMSLNKFPSEYHDQVYFGIARGTVGESPLDALELLPLTTVWNQPRENQGRPEESVIRVSRPHIMIEQIIADAAANDPIATIEWLNSEASQLDEYAKQQYLNEVFQSWTRSDPDGAFEMALQIPIYRDNNGLEATVVTWLSFSDVDRAITLLPRVRAGKTKTEAYRSVGMRLAKQVKISEAVRLGNDLSERDRKEYLETLSSSVGMRTPFSHLEAGIRDLPSQELKSIAASRALIVSNSPIARRRGDSAFSEQERDQLKEYLTPKDKTMVEMLDRVD